MGDSVDLISVIKEIPKIQDCLRKKGEYRKANMLDFAEDYLKTYYNSRIQKTGLSFGNAFESLKRSPETRGMRLPQWSEDVVIKIQKPDEHSKMTAPYLYVESRFGRVPWKETMIELFSEKWEIVEFDLRDK